MDRRGQTWTREEEQNLRELFKSHDVHACAEILGRTVNAIVTRLERMDLIREIPTLRGYYRIGECVYRY